MKHLFLYHDELIYAHHTVDENPDPDKFNVHTHETLELFYYISGKGSFLIEGELYELHPGDILLLREAETHKLLISPDEPYERIAIHFPRELIQRINPELLLPFTERELGTRNLYSGTIHPRLLYAFEHFDFEIGSFTRDQIFSRLLLFLSELGQLYRIPGETLPQDPYSVFLVRYVNEHLFEEISVRTISDHFMKSVSQISRDFRKATGSSIWEYIHLKRLFAAKARISQGDPPTRVSADCGFKDYSAFFRAYKARFGYAPSRERPEI